MLTMTSHHRVETPIVPKGQRREVIVLLDTSGSMEWEAAEGSPVTRWQIISEAMPQFVRALEGEDTAAAAERAGGTGNGGGLLIHGFSNLHTALGDFNSSNFSHKWQDIQVGGGTTIMPAWRAAQEDYVEEFGDVDPDDRPALLTLVITDGEATDAAEFDEVLENAEADRYFAVAIVGHGEEHDRTLATYEGAARVNPRHVSVVSFESVTNPRELASDLIVMAGA
jgi:Mg-chelatase subunit ChlD